MDERGRPRGEGLVPGGSAGDATSLHALADDWFDPCVDVAYRILDDLDEAADVAQQAFLGPGPATLGPRRMTSLGTWALRTTRDEALSQLSRRRSARPAGAAPGAGTDQADVVRAVFAALGASDASALDLHLRHDLAVEDVAEALGVSPTEAQQLLFRLKRRLGAAMRAWALWPGSVPDEDGCTELTAAIEDAGVQDFGPEAVQVVTQHARSCGDCRERQRSRPAPEAVFADVPVMSVPELRERALAALADAARSSAGGADAAPAAAPAGDTAATPESAVPPEPPPPLPSRVPGQTSRNGDHAGGSGPDPHHRPPAELGVRGIDDTTPPPSPPNGSAPSVGDTGPTPAVGDRPAPGVQPTTGHSAGSRAAATGEHVAASTYRPYTYRRWRTGRRQLVGIGLAVVLVLGMSLAVVAFTRGGRTTSSDGDGTASVDGDGTTSVPADGTPTTTLPPTTTVPSEAPAADADGRGDSGDQPAAPEIGRFEVVGQGLGSPCRAQQRRISLAWETRGARTAQLDGPGAPTDALPASGRATVCRDNGPPATYTLTVDGPGGTTFRTTTA